MTKVWTALAITVLIFTLAFTELFLTENVSDNILETLDKTEISAKDNSENTERLCGEIQNLWNSKKNRLEIFLSHGDIDQIDISIENIIRYCEQSEFDKLYIECGVLKNHMNSLKDSETINLHNIF